MRRRAACAGMLAVVLAGCGAPGGAEREGASRGSQADAAAAARASRPRIVFLGDSLTEGLGLEGAESYPSLVQRRLDEAGYHYTVVNAGVSGDTAAGGRRRLAWSIEGDVRVLVVALGANDGLRGLPVDQLRENLDAIVAGARARGITVVLAGMEAPPNNGVDYAARFRAVYAELARAHGVRLIPFLLDGVAGVAALNQADLIHPNAAGARRVADLVWTAVEPLLARPADPPR